MTRPSDDGLRPSLGWRPLMQESQQLTRQGLLWLILSQLAVVGLFVTPMPIWVMPVMLLTASWRFRMLQKRWQLPSGWVKALAVLLSLGAVAVSDIHPLSLDAATILLLLGFSLKNLEMAQRRDAILAVYIGYFLVAVSFLFSQTLLATLTAILVLMLLTATLIGVQLTRPQPMIRTLKISSSLLVLSLPLMIVGYLFFPRLPPLWSVPMQQNQARTGISDSMSPGDFASIAGSGALAFRATFSGNPPQQVDRYWRGPVLTHFDGNTWTPTTAYVERRNFLPDRIQPSGSPVFQPNWQLGDAVGRYSVVYEPSNQWFAYSLTPSRVMNGEARVGQDFQVVATQKMDAPLWVEYEYYQNAVLDPVLSERERQATLQLPTGIEPRTRAFIEDLRIRHTDPQALILATLRWFQESPFYYTLSPGTLPTTNSVDAFLFDSKRGFCAHYAGAFVVMMRMAGIPARVVSGYQGGEWNEKGGFIAVHEFDAHAWVELWLPSAGWVAFDPTAWVAPERIEQNLRSAVADSGGFLNGSPLYALQFSWFNGLRLSVDAWQFRWQRWIMDYDQRGQSLFIARWLGNIDSTTAVAYALGFITLLGLFWIAALGLLQPHHSKDPIAAQWQMLRDQLGRYGIDVDQQVTPSQLSSLLAGLSALQQQAVQQYANQLNRYLYHSDTPPYADIKRQYRNAIAALEPRWWKRALGFRHLFGR